MGVRLRAALFAVIAASGACRERATPPGETEASARPAPSARPPASAPQPQREVRVLGCRVLSVNGPNAKTTGAVFSGNLLDGGEWLDVPEGVALSLRHSQTTREFALHGPGRFLPCPLGAESVLVASGAFASSAGPGARAGAEVLIGTPFGTVRYGDANLRVDVRPKGLELNVKQGTALFSRAGELGAQEAPKSVAGPNGRVAFSAAVDADGLAQRCATLTSALAGGRLAAASATPSAGPALATWAVAQLRARQAARLACAEARPAVARLDTPERSRLSGLITGPEATAPDGTATVPDGGK